MTRRILAGQQPRARRVADTVERQDRDHWQDRPTVGWAIVVALFAGCVLASYGMGWLS
jgi:hypothetical protein